MNIKPGDIVEYTDTVSIKEDKQLKHVKVIKKGIWDGEKVILNDKEQTTVYKLEWLTKVKSLNEILKEAANNYLNNGAPTERELFIAGAEFYKNFKL